MGITFSSSRLSAVIDTLKIFSVALAVGMLAACEESASSPSSGSKEFTDEAGTYTGTVDVHGSAPDFGYDYTLNDEPITIVVSSDGKVTVTFLGQNETRYINSQVINVTFDFDEHYQSYACAGTIAVNGQFTEDNQKILGSVSGNGTCNDGASTSPIIIEGRLQAAK